jgi:hypothetical protein
MTKRPGVTSDNGFILKKINENLNVREKNNYVSRFGGLH